MQYVVVATAEEVRLIEHFPNLANNPVIITGVGGTNVINALNGLSKEVGIVNIGFAGSADLEIGKMYRVKECRLFHKVPFAEKTYNLLSGDIACYTSTDFVTEGPAGVLFDMELAFICAMGFKSIISYKFVSDHCNLEEYEQFKGK